MVTVFLVGVWLWCEASREVIKWDMEEMKGRCLNYREMLYQNGDICHCLVIVI